LRDTLADDIEVEEFAMKDPPLFRVEGVVSACPSYGSDTDNEFDHHMVAVVKSSRIEGLTASNTMPYWWSTECWRNQFPVDANITCDFDMEAIRATPEERTISYCPPYAAVRKIERPKIDK
jgi:hypothetical protein